MSSSQPQQLSHKLQASKGLFRFGAVLAVLIVFFAACGRESHKTEIDLNGHAIVWSGYADGDPNLKKLFDETVVCLTGHSMTTRPGYAFVIVIDGSFKCNGVLARGCAELSGATIYMDKEYLYSTVFVHEVIHWETGMGNEFHDTAQFNYCLTRVDDTA